MMCVQFQRLMVSFLLLVLFYILSVDSFGTFALNVVTDLTPIIPIVNDVAKPTVEFLKNAVLPQDTPDGIAIFISEGVSGALGGLAAKIVTRIDGNKNNKESSLVNAEISGAYFGVTGAIRSLAQISGLSAIAINLLALFLATVISEGLKFRSRSIIPQRKKVSNDGPTMYDLMKFKNPSMFDLMKFRNYGDLPFIPRMPMVGKFSENELKADIVKWLIVYSFLPSNTNLVELDDAVAIGAISGLFSQLVREADDKELAGISADIKNKARKPWDKSRRAKADFPLTRFARASIEGAIQLFAYEAARDYVYAIAPLFQNPMEKMSMSSSAELSPLTAILTLLKEFYSGGVQLKF